MKGGFKIRMLTSNVGGGWVSVGGGAASNWQLAQP